MPGLRVLSVLTSLAVAAMPAPVAAGPADGQKLFTQRCAGCHSVTGKNGVGPALNGVAGRKAASAKGYGYSPALSRSGLVWTDAALDAYLASPMKAVPGGKMLMAVPAPAQRADIIAWLKGVR